MYFRSNKKNHVHFDGTKEIESKIKNQTDNVISRRFRILIIFVCAIAFVFIVKLFMTQIANHDYYETKLTQYNTDTFTADAFRGSIYDRDYKRLVYNKNINCATYYAIKDIKDEEIEVIVNFLIDNIHIDISKVSKRDKKDYLIMKDEKFTDSLITEEEKQRYADNDDKDTILYNLKLSKITDEILAQKLSDNDVRFYKLFYEIKNCKSGSTVIIEGLSVKEASIIGENSSLLRGIKVTNDWEREYQYDEFKSVLGKVTTKQSGIPANMKERLLALDYRNNARVGTSGLEAQYENILKGEAATYKLTYDKNGNPIVKPNTPGSQGQNIRLTIDWDLQEKMGEAVESELKRHTGYGNRFNTEIMFVMMNPKNGDVLVMTGKKRDKIGSEIYDYSSSNYLSAYRMGSTVKGGTIYNAYKNNVLSPGEVYDDRAIKIKGTKEKGSWKYLGKVNDVQALAQSSNVYMFHLAIKLAGGHYEYGQPLVGMDPTAFQTMRNGFGELGLGVKTGLDVPNEKLGYRGDAQLAGNLLDFAIGQYDTYTPIQLAQYASTIANKGIRVQPRLFLESFTEDENNNYVSLYQNEIKILDDLTSYETAFTRIQMGFRQCVLTGTGKRVNGPYNPAGKTGTAEDYTMENGKTGKNDYPNHMFIGYAPYDDPEVVVACMANRQESDSGESCKPLAKLAFDEYFKKYGIKSK